jgi:cysteinyl-tRNA synthetase
MKKLFLYNTLGKEMQEFIPLTEGVVKMYGCGPTVYNYAHIGHMRCYVFEDVLRRVLLRDNYDVLFVMNVTDVGHLESDSDVGEDKLKKQSALEGKSVKEIAKFYEDDFFYNLELLNIKKPNIVARASEHVEEQIKIVENFIKDGVAYKLEDGWYFDTSKIDNYSCLNCVKEEGEVQGRIKATGKKNKADFAVWKFSNNGGEYE